MMLEIITTVATFGNWRDCYLYMEEENMKEINMLKMRYCLDDLFGSAKFTIDQVKQMWQMN